jgi:DNA-binding MarR family transcriptional regulator
MADSTTGAADELCELFPALYLRFCRRREPGETRITPQMDAVLLHLAMSGPLTVGEMGAHFARAQSVVSEIVNGLEKKGLLERMRDERDRRRTLVWLTDEARELLERRRQVLDAGRVARAMERLTRSQREALLAALRALVGDAPGASARVSSHTRGHDRRRRTR